MRKSGRNLAFMAHCGTEFFFEPYLRKLKGKPGGIEGKVEDLLDKFGNTIAVRQRNTA